MTYNMRAQRAPGFGMEPGRLGPHAAPGQGSLGCISICCSPRVSEKKQDWGAGEGCKHLNHIRKSRRCLMLTVMQMRGVLQN